MRHVIDRSVSSVFDSVFEKESASNLCDHTRSLRRLIPAARFFAASDLRFTQLAGESADAQPGELVVYRIGQDCPTQVVADAVARGAAGILTEQVLPCPLPQCIVGDVNLAMAQINAETLDHPDRKLLTVGVIGSAGKTTTALLVAALFRGGGIRTAYQTDLGQCDGVVQSTPQRSLPTHAELVSWFAEARDGNCRAAIVEISQDAVRHGAYDAIQFDLLIITGRSGARDDFGESALQCAIDRLATNGVVIAPADDQRTIRTIRDAGTKLISYGTGNAADVSVSIIEQSTGMTTLLVTHGNTTAAMETTLCGEAMAANLAAASATGLLIAQPIHEVVERLSRLREIPGRGQHISRIGDAHVVLDSAGTPQRARTALSACRAMKGTGKLWTVLSIDAGDDPEQLALYGRFLEQHSDQVIVTSAPESKRQFLSTCHYLLDGVKKCAAMRLVADQGRAIEWALGEADVNDTVLILGGLGGCTPHHRRSEINRLIERVRQQSAEPEIYDIEQYR